MEARKEDRCRGSDDIAHRAYIGASLFVVGFTFPYHFVQIQNRLLVTGANLIGRGMSRPTNCSRMKIWGIAHHNKNLTLSTSSLMGGLWTCVSTLSRSIESGPRYAPTELGDDPGRAYRQDMPALNSALSTYSPNHTPKIASYAHEPGWLKFPCGSIYPD